MSFSLSPHTHIQTHTVIVVVAIESLSHVQVFCDPMDCGHGGTAAHQAPLSLGFPRREYWSGLPFPSLEYIPDPGIESRSAALLADSLPLSHQGRILYIHMYIYTLRPISVTYFQIPV